jgi:hypothetical protein
MKGGKGDKSERRSCRAELHSCPLRWLPIERARSFAAGCKSTAAGGSGSCGFDPCKRLQVDRCADGAVQSPITSPLPMARVQLRARPAQSDEHPRQEQDFVKALSIMDRGGSIRSELEAGQGAAPLDHGSRRREGAHPDRLGAPQQYRCVAPVSRPHACLINDGRLMPPCLWAPQSQPRCRAPAPAEGR